MSRYTSSDFGFSFWYPAAWKVTNEPVSDPTRGGWFPDAKIVQELQIRSPDASAYDQAGSVILQVLIAPPGLTELGRSKSPSPVGIDEKYFFDKRRRRWMCAHLSESPDGTPPLTIPVQITQRTMGGLPILIGAVRGGVELIVPLDGSHFLAIMSTDAGGDYSHAWVAKTVVAADPDAGKRESPQAQEDTIRREAAKFASIDK